MKMKKTIGYLISCVGILCGFVGSAYFAFQAASQTAALIHRYGIDNIPRQLAAEVVLHNIPCSIVLVFVTGMLLTGIQKREE